MITNPPVLNCELPKCKGTGFFAVLDQPGLDAEQLRSRARDDGWLTRSPSLPSSANQPIGSKDVCPTCQLTRSVHGTMAHRVWIHVLGPAELVHPPGCLDCFCPVATALPFFSQDKLGALRLGQYACAVDSDDNFIVGAYLTEDEATRVQDPKTVHGGGRWVRR